MSLQTAAGSAEANSFNTVVEISTYVARVTGSSTTWDAYTTNQKELYAMLAFDFMGSELMWKGYKAYKDQAGCFPRYQCQEVSGTPINQIPEAVKEAHALIAALVMPRLIADVPATTVSAVRPSITSLSLGGLSVGLSQGAKFSDENADSWLRANYPHIYYLLVRFMTSIKAAVVSERSQLTYTTTTSTSTTSTTSTSTSSTTTTTTEG